MNWCQAFWHLQYKVARYFMAQECLGNYKNRKASLLIFLCGPWIWLKHSKADFCPPLGCSGVRGILCEKCPWGSLHTVHMEMVGVTQWCQWPRGTSPAVVNHGFVVMFWCPVLDVPLWGRTFYFHYYFIVCFKNSIPIVCCRNARGNKAIESSPPPSTSRDSLSHYWELRTALSSPFLPIHSVPCAGTR